MQIRLVVIVPAFRRGNERLDAYGASLITLCKREGQFGAQRGSGVVVEGIELLAWSVERRG